MKWLKIEERPNYSVSDSGLIRNDKTGRILKPHLGTSGYHQVMLGRKTVPLYVHRLVAKAFLENQNDLPQVDHINGDKTDNKVDNLRWVSVSENCMAYGYENRINNRKKKVIAIKGEEKLFFDSRNDTAAYFGCDKSKIKYNYLFKTGKMQGWMFKLVKDIV